MPVNLKGRSLLKLLDFSPEEIEHMVLLAQGFKQLKQRGVPHRLLEGRNIVLLFEKTSTRTRCAFEVGAMDLGMGVTYLDPAGSQMGNKESVEDTARVLGRMYDGIEYRGFAQQTVECLAAYAGVPVWNGLTDQFHPTQMIADLLTLREQLGPDLRGRTLAFFGDARNNVANSLMVACAKMGMNFRACGPDSLMPEQWLVDVCRDIAQQTGASIALTQDVDEGAAGADAVYTDIWVSMGEPEGIWEQRIELLSPYRVSQQVIDRAAPGAVFMHCLPSFHDTKTTVGQRIYEAFGVCEMEVCDAVFESEASCVFDQAENRMHSIKAIMYATLSDEPIDALLAS